MSNFMVENQTEQVSIFLEDAINLITNYVNYHTLPSLLEETPAGNERYYKGLLASMRRLSFLRRRTGCMFCFVE